MSDKLKVFASLLMPTPCLVAVLIVFTVRAVLVGVAMTMATVSVVIGVSSLGMQIVLWPLELIQVADDI